MAGQEGLEPPAPGFGVRCSTIRATGLSRLFCFFVWGMCLAKCTVLLKLKLVRSIFFVFHCGVISSFASSTSKRHYISHIGILKTDYPSIKQCWGNQTDYFIISATTPAPTVLPPSRIAKRSPASIAIGVISSAVTDTLSPGITISVPSGNVTTPVTSVVLK